MQISQEKSWGFKKEKNQIWQKVTDVLNLRKFRVFCISAEKIQKSVFLRNLNQTDGPKYELYCLYIFIL